MKRVMMIAVVIVASFVFVPVSVFAAEDHNSSRSNLSNSISKVTTQVGCKNAGGVWVVDAHGKGSCNRGASKANKGKGELKIRLGPMNK